MKNYKVTGIVKKVLAGVLAAAVSLSVYVMPAFASDTYEIDTYVPIGSLTDANRDSGSNILNGTNIGGMWYRGKQIDTLEAGYGLAMQINHNGIQATENMGAMSFSNILPGNGNSDIYSISFDLKIPENIQLSSSDYMYLEIEKNSTGRAALIYLIDGMIVICKGGAWTTIDSITDTSAGQHDNYTCVPFNKGEWLHFEMVVDTSNAEYTWYINGDNKHSATFAKENDILPTAEKAVITKMNIYYNMTTPASCGFAYMDNVQTAYVIKKSVARDTDMLKAYNDVKDDSTVWGGKFRYQQSSGAEVVEVGDIYGNAVKMNLSGDNEKIVPDQSEEYPAATDRYIISYDIKLNKNTAGLMANAIGGGGKNNGPAVFAKTEDTTGNLYMQKIAGWPTYNYVATANNATHSVAKYDIGKWMSVSYVVDKMAKTIELYLDGKVIGQSDFSSFTELKNAEIEAVWFRNGKEGNTKTDVYVDNFRLSEITDGSFYATGEVTEGAVSNTINLAFTETPNVIDVDDIKVTDASGNAVVITERQQKGNNIILTTSTKSNMYTVTLPEHTTGTSGNVIAGNIVKIYGKGVFVTQNQLKADGAVLGAEDLGNVSAGSKITFETAFSNDADDETPAKRIVLLGAYNADGVLVDVDTANIEIAKGETVVAAGEQIPFINKTADIEKVVGFIWKDDYIPVVEFVQSTKTSE